MGQGRGGGGDEQSIVIGYGVAVGLIVFMCTFGVPMIIAGGILVAIFPYGSTYVIVIVAAVAVVNNNTTTNNNVRLH